jgi:hypothetical protein
MTLLHFDYFRKHEEFTPEARPPQDEHVKKTDLIETDLIENHENNDKNEVFSQEHEKKAS